MLFRKDRNSISSIEINGTPLGILPEAMVEEQVLQLRPGDRVLMGSDGFFEVPSPDHRLFMDIAARQWEALQEVPVDKALSLICEGARNHGNGTISDDLMVVAFEQPPFSLDSSILALHLPSTMESVDQACERLDSYFCSSGIAARIASGSCFDIALAVREALLNAVSHGNGDQPGTFVDFRCEIEESEHRLVVSVTDEGRGFDFEHHLSPEDDLSERGRGMQLIRHTADKSQMVGAELTMTFSLKEDAHAHS